jgi:hypothetical protein
VAKILREIDKYYADRGTPVKRVVELYEERRNVRPEAMLLALERTYAERNMHEPMSLIHRAYLLALRLDKAMIKWEKRQWWKKFLKAVFFPETIHWEYNKWGM